jgi:uncharacterized protein (TIGR00270 family)
MGACELCGAEGVSTRRATVSHSTLECCTRCIDSMSLPVKRSPPVLKTPKSETTVIGRGVSGIDIMTKEETELAGDFHNRIRNARKERGISQEELAKRMNEKIGTVQKAETGIRPTDNLLEKFSKTLGISLMVDSTPSGHTVVASESNRKMTISDAKSSMDEVVKPKKSKKRGRKLGVSRSGARSRR